MSCFIMLHEFHPPQYLGQTLADAAEVIYIKASSIVSVRPQDYGTHKAFGSSLTIMSGEKTHVLSVTEKAHEVLRLIKEAKR